MILQNHMKKNIFLGLTIAAVLIVGSNVGAQAASALTIDDLQAQIKSLLARIAELRTQATVSSDTSVSGNAGVSASMPSKHRICAILNRNLSRGTQGDDVRGLQEFLSAEGYFSANATGYFGPVTASAVARWQASQGVSAVGAVGPISRERIKVWCGGGVSERFSATPQRGTAPLAVTFYTNISGFRPVSDQYTIDFGDGVSERAADCFAPADACQSPGENKHTYTSDGTYTATLTHTSDPCGGNPLCRAPISQEVVGKVQIYVGTQAGCTKEYVPVCGSKPIVCITTPCNPVQQTYGNRCMMQADGATFLYQGACRSDSANKPPVVSGFSGPTSLTLNETGTWRISASDPENGNLSYSVIWGDEWYANTGAQTSSSAPSIVQSTTFTHSYSNAGTYTVSVVVNDQAGNQARATATVQVTNANVACTLQYDPVCGRPSGCANTCAPGMYCTMECRLHEPQTYGNRCQLNAANAEFLYSGQCSGATQ
jgi:peptidoglycan hydrolase-like protein with peptidoglycan-binding domain